MITKKIFVLKPKTNGSFKAMMTVVQKQKTANFTLKLMSFERTTYYFVAVDKLNAFVKEIEVTDSNCLLVKDACQLSCDSMEVVIFSNQNQPLLVYSKDNYHILLAKTLNALNNYIIKKQSTQTNTKTINQNTLNELTSSTNETASSLNEMTSSTNETASSLNELTSSTNETASSLNELTSSTNETASSLNELPSSTSETASSLNEQERLFSKEDNSLNEDASQLNDVEDLVESQEIIESIVFPKISVPAFHERALLTVARPYNKRMPQQTECKLSGISRFILNEYVISGNYIKKISASLLKMLHENKRNNDLCERFVDGYFVTIYGEFERFIKNYGGEYEQESAILPHYEVGILFQNERISHIVYAVNCQFVKKLKPSFIEIKTKNDKTYYICCQKTQDGKVDNSCIK